MEKKAKNFHKKKGQTSISTGVVLDTKPTDTKPANNYPNSVRNNTSSVNPGIKKVDIDTSSYKTEMRRDYLNDYYVLIAPKRHKRHFDANTNSKHRLYETASSPRLDNQEEAYSLKDKNGHWITKVVNNLYPALSIDNAAAYGTQEIVIDTPLSNTQLGELDNDQIVNLLLTYQTRTKQLLAVPNIKYVLVFKNEGFLAGASLAHSHTQIFALPMAPPRYQTEANVVEAYFDARKTDPFEDIIKFESVSKSRIIWEDKNFLAFCPYASLWPMEVRILAKRPVTSIVDFTTDEIFSIAKPVKLVTKKLTEHEIDYNFFLQNGITKHQRFSLHITPRSLNTWGGFEVATGMIINSLPPEAAAKWYLSD